MCNTCYQELSPEERLNYHANDNEKDLCIRCNISFGKEAELARNNLT